MSEPSQKFSVSPQHEQSREPMQLGFFLFFYFQLTRRRIHCTAITDNKAISAAAFAQLEERVLDLDHRSQEILLKLET